MRIFTHTEKLTDRDAVHRPVWRWLFGFISICLFALVSIFAVDQFASPSAADVKVEIEAMATTPSKSTVTVKITNTARDERYLAASNAVMEYKDDDQLELRTPEIISPLLCPGESMLQEFSLPYDSHFLPKSIPVRMNTTVWIAKKTPLTWMGSLLPRNLFPIPRWLRLQFKSIPITTNWSSPAETSFTN